MEIILSFHFFTRYHILRVSQGFSGFLGVARVILAFKSKTMTSMINLNILVLIHLSHYARIVQTHHINLPTDQSILDDVCEPKSKQSLFVRIICFHIETL